MTTPAIPIDVVAETHELPTVIIDRDYKIVAANRNYCELHGVSAAEIVGRRCHEVSHHSDVPCHLNGEQCPHQEVFASNRACEVLHTHFDAHGQPDHVRIKAKPLSDGAQPLYLMETIQRLAPRFELSCEEMRMVGRSPALLACIENLSIAAKSDAAVLLYGESGVGKELAAHYIHTNSPRHSAPYVELNCAAIPESLCESELFGHERGAFTGCAGLKRGLFETAEGGTLFLDEIGELPMSMQAKLLRVLDSGQTRRIGGHNLIQTNVRVLTATNRDLQTLVAEGKFRQDLYFRIAGIKVSIPPLRERKMDIPALVEFMLRRMGQKDTPLRLAHDAIDRLLSYDYPGNIRELRNVLLKAMASAADGTISARDICFDHGPPPGYPPRPHINHEAAPPLTSQRRRGRLTDTAAQHVTDLLQRHGDNRRVVAQVLGISERTLYRMLRELRVHSAGLAADIPANHDGEEKIRVRD
jgi:two-component system response regulator AtoC